MDNQDRRKNHIPGHESHGVYVCHKCGWPFPNPHPSPKHRRAHRKICGTIEGHKLLPSEGSQTHLNGSDDEHVSDDDRKRALVVSVPDTLDSGNSEKGNDGMAEKLVRSEDEVFSDAVADFADSGISSGTKKEDSLDSGTNVETVHIIDRKFSGSSEDNNSNSADVNQLTVKPSGDCQIENPKILRSEKNLPSVEVGNTLELHGELSGSMVDPLSNSIANLRAEESTVVCSDDCFGLSSDSHTSKAKAMTDVLPENKIYVSENVTDCSLTPVSKETNLKGNDDIKSDREVVETVVSSDNFVGETCGGPPKIDASDAVTSDHQVADGAVNLQQKNNGEFLSVPPQDDFPPEANSVVISIASSNDVQIESSYVIEFTTSSDVKTLHEKRCEGTANVETLPICDDRPAEANPQRKYEDFKDHEGVASENPLSLHLSKNEENDLKETVAEDDNFLFKPSQLTEKSDVLSSDMNVLDSSMMKELMNSAVVEEMHVEECTEVSPVELTFESNKQLDEIGVSKDFMETEMNESHMVHFSEELETDVVISKNSQQISLPEGTLMASSNENPRDASSGSATSDTTNVVKIDDISHHEENRTEANYVKVDGKAGGSNVENDIGTEFQSLEPNDLLQLEVKQSSDLVKSDEENRIEVHDVAVDGKDGGANVESDIGTKIKSLEPSDLMLLDVKQLGDLVKSDDAGEMGETEKYEIDAPCGERVIVRDTSLHESVSSHFESPRFSEVLLDESARKSKGTECTKRDPLSASLEDVEDEINSNNKVHEECNRSVGTSADSHQALDAELLVKTAEDLARKFSSPSSINSEPSAQCDSSVGDNQDGERGGEVSGITAVPIQDQSGNHLVKLGSSGINASVDSGSRCDSLEGNWGSVSVLSLQSDAPAVIDAEALSSTGLLVSPESGKSNLNNPKAASGRPCSGKSELFEPPSFMTLVEPGNMVGPKAAASEFQKRPNPQHLNYTSLQAGWFPTLTEIANESQGRKKNEGIIAKVTDWGTGEEQQHTPLKSLLGEAAHGNKPKSPKLEENLSSQKTGKVLEDKGSGLVTVNSILGPESPAATKVLRGEAANEWNSPARYPAGMKREKRKVKSRPFWIPLVCCSTVDHQRS